jgi:phage shock protein PspC (stress-responsive transcriptional regulator)
MTEESDHGRWDEPPAGGPSSDQPPGTGIAGTTRDAQDAAAQPDEAHDEARNAAARDEEAVMTEMTDTRTGPQPESPADPGGPGTGTPPPGGSAGPGEPGAGSPPGTGAEFFDRIRALGLVRPQDDRWLAGVCVATARRWNIDPILARGLAVVLVLLGPGVLLYGLAWAFLPKEDGRIHAQQVLTGDVSLGFVGAALLVIGWLVNPAMRFGHDGLGWGGPVLVVAALIALAIWWYVRKEEGRPLWPGGNHHGGTASGTWYGPGQQPGTSPTTSPSTSPTTGPTTGTADWKAVSRQIETSAERWGQELGAASRRMGDAAGTWAGGVGRPRPEQPPRRRVDPAAPSKAISRTATGLALLAGALAAVLDRVVGLPGSTWVLGLSAALVMVAVGIVTAGVIGRRPGGLAPLGVLLALGLLVSFAVGDRTWRPADAAQARQDYQLVAGQAVLDLGRLPATGASLDATVGVGDLTVKVPAGTAAEIRTAIGAGTLRTGTSTDSLRSVRRAADQHRTVLVIGDPERAAEHVVEAQVGLGRLTVLGADAKVSDR